MSGPSGPSGTPGDADDETPVASPDDAPSQRARPGVVPSVAAGCVGFLIFYLGGFALAIGGARAGKVGAAIVSLLILIVATFVVSSAGASGRPMLARVAIGIGVAALVFGGCLALLAGGKIRIAG